MKILPSGIAVIEGDRWLSAWIEEQGKLDVDGRAHEAAARFIKPGDVVVDAGASLGDTTAAFLKAVGPTGAVYAFEPNPVAFEALKHNCPAAICHSYALGAINETRTLRIEDGNIGASWLDGPGGDIHVWPLDNLEMPQLNFIKIDVEGCEPLVLAGAEATIRRCRPTMLVEINHPVLARLGFAFEDIKRKADAWDYRIESADPRYGLDLPQTDAYLIPG